MKPSLSNFMYVPVITVLLLLLPPAWIAAAAAQSLDDSYRVLTSYPPSRADGKTVVLEVFWYGCPHCYAFEPHLRQWLSANAGNVVLRLMPGMLNRGWVAHARAFYTAEALGILEQIHHPLFEAIHDENRDLFQDDAIKAFFIEQGVDGDAFSAIYNSTEVAEQLRQAMEIQMQYRIEGVPSIIINDKYLSSPSMAGGYDQLLKVMDYLADK